MGNIAVQFENVGKLYQLGNVGTGSLSHDFNRWWQTKILRREDPYLKVGEANDRATRGSSDFVWALHNISYSIEQGDVVGIIGRNGAGKSTLLKLLSRVTAPTTGVIRAKGRIASLLEVGTGFHPEMTGRENIYMNGSIMGMTRIEITRKLEEIVDFAGVERYLDTPIKRYSSGMMVRLGFAVAAFLEPEILVVDEVLAVGDAEFQKKAIGKMQDVANGYGRTVLFVSHNMAAVKNLCKSGIVLDKGMIMHAGTADDAINRYLYSCHQQSIGDHITDKIIFIKPTLHISNIRINGTDKCETTVKSGQRTMDIEISGTSEEDITTDILLRFKTRDDVSLATLAEGHYRGRFTKIRKGAFCIRRKIKFPKYLCSGEYWIDLMLHHPMVEWQMRALHCMTVTVQGNQDDFGFAICGQDDGFFGFETED